MSSVERTAFSRRQSQGAIPFADLNRKEHSSVPAQKYSLISLDSALPFFPKDKKSDDIMSSSIPAQRSIARFFNAKVAIVALVTLGVLGFLWKPIGLTSPGGAIEEPAVEEKRPRWGEALTLLPRERWGSTAFAKAALPKSCPGSFKPQRQFALIIDAGSTGSRIHVYRFHICDPSSPPILEDEVFVQTKPGLSSYADDAEKGAKSLDQLLVAALENVPMDDMATTPVTVKATAGLRLLGAEKSDEILKQVEKRLRYRFPFHVVDKDGVVVMDGKDEGVYAWITVNYLLGNLDQSKSNHPTAAIMDLGGASTQIVFEPSSSSNFKMADGEHKYSLTFGGKKYTLFQHSYLRYGLIEGRKRVKAGVLEQLGSSSPAPIPCHETSYTDKVADTPLQGSGADFESCHELVTSHLFSKNPSTCTINPCSFDGVYQPKMKETFDEERDLFAFSYFWDRTEPLGMVTDDQGKQKEVESMTFNIGAIKDAAKVMCPSTSSILPKSTNMNLDHLTPAKVTKFLGENPDWCLDLTYMYALLTTGYELPDERKLKLAKKINGVGTGWCLGAAMAVIDEFRSKKQDE